MNLLKSPWHLFFFISFLIYVGIRGVYARQLRGVQSVHRQVDGLEVFLLVLVIGTSMLMPLLFLFTPLLSFADYRLPELAQWCGAALMIPALWLFWRSHADLGRNWSATLELRKDHELVTHGVYRLIRHPMYAAIFLVALAQGLLLSNWLAGWSAFAPFLLMYVLRTPREERMMAEHFGPAYRDYMQRTGRLVPRIFQGKEKGSAAGDG